MSFKKERKIIMITLINTINEKEAAYNRKTTRIVIVYRCIYRINFEM